MKRISKKKSTDKTPKEKAYLKKQTKEVVQGTHVRVSYDVAQSLDIVIAFIEDVYNDEIEALGFKSITRNDAITFLLIHEPHLATSSLLELDIDSRMMKLYSYVEENTKKASEVKA